ncbi:type 1 fimbrial protein [Buttiauxella sp. B2]|uniref:fimbrial protein n=1 Tax=Buttiauxella sp. B2 TaxID=2587812 RepID=UPI001120D1C0|nr:fimbrial protein [Buttiauxella sp. B2]TNV22519.1 type 1 fimbrial protein [Buttiauxella sp. B2]
MSKRVVQPNRQDRRWHRCRKSLWANLRVTGLSLTLGITGSLFYPANATTSKPPDNWVVEGAHGEVRIHGLFTEGACRLDATSAYQDIDLGTSSRVVLEHEGDQGIPVPVLLKLRDCIRMQGNGSDMRTGRHTWDPIQPVVTVSFLAPADPDSPELVKVSGVTGLGLRIMDAQHRDIRLGARGIPQFITPGSDELVYYVTLERTLAPLTTGIYRAVVHFMLDYD